MHMTVTLPRLLPRPRLTLCLASGALLLLVGCRPAPPPAAPAPEPPPTPAPAPQIRWQWLNTAELQATEALIAAADQGPLAADAPERKAFLKAYAAAFAELSPADAPVLSIVRRLWELGAAARRAHLSAGEVRRAVGLGKATAPPSAGKASAQQPVPGARLVSLDALAPQVRKLLQAAQRDGKPTTAFVQQWVRRVAIVEDPAFLSPDLPLKCEGAVETLTGTVFLTERDAITGETRPPFKAAAALVHEAEHVRWFYTVAGDDPRMLFKAPDERNAYRGMFLFLRDVRLNPAAAADASALEADMQKWRGILAQANTLLGYPADDLTPRHELLVSDEALRTDPVGAVATPADQPAVDGPQ